MNIDYYRLTRDNVECAYKGDSITAVLPAQVNRLWFHDNVLRYLNNDEFSIETLIKFPAGKKALVEITWKKKGRNKPLVVLKDWMFIANGKKVQGIAVEHYKEELIGEEVESGVIVKKEGDMVETKNFRYKLI